MVGNKNAGFPVLLTNLKKDQCLFIRTEKRFILYLPEGTF